jgi:hypothetical protein
LEAIVTDLPVIDYDAHPAFAGLRSASYEANAKVDALTEEIDAGYSRIAADIFETEQDCVDMFDREVAPKIEKIASLLEGAPGLNPAFAPHAARAVRTAATSMREDLNARQRHASARNSAMAELSAAQTEQLNALRQDGFYKFLPNDALARRVLALTAIDRALLRRRAKKSPKRHCAVALHPRSAAARLLKQALESNGVAAVASAYMGKPMEFLYASLDYAHPRQDWYKGCYDDVGLPTSKTVYMHFDADCDVLKAMMYLKDVTGGDGPFSFVRGSHLWDRSPFVMAVQKGLDREQCGMFAMEDDGLDYKLGYYRPLYHDARHRVDILSLPKTLRGTTHFGDDVLDGSEFSNVLLSGEEVFTGAAGTLVMFDGSRGVHRGSLVDGGSRWAVQLAFRAKRDSASAAAPTWKRMLRPVFHQLHYAAHTIRNLAWLIAG